MAMGLSTQTSPLSPYCPSYFWLSQSCSRSSSSGSLMASSKALCRRGGCTIQNYRIYHTRSPYWKLVPNISNSSAKMLLHYKDQNNIDGNLLNKTIVNPQDGKGKQVLRHFDGPPLNGTDMMYNTKSGNSAEWLRAAKMRRYSLDEYRSHHKPMVHAIPRIDCAVPDTASAELKCGGDCNIAVKEKNDLKFEQSNQTGLHSNNIPRNDPQPNGSQNLEERKEMNSAVTDAVANSSTDKEAHRQPDLRERLSSIYDSVLVDNNITKEKNDLKFDQSNQTDLHLNNIPRKDPRPNGSPNLKEREKMDSAVSNTLAKTSKEANRQPDLRERLSSIYGSVLVVDNITKAKEVVVMLTNKYRHLVHACDTEVAKIDVKQETPVDHGEITCFSIYSGAEADFGNGKSSVWVDVLDGGGWALLAEFAPFFEDLSIKKVWHNYSFDNHVIENYGLRVSGFHADTMHMARLWDSSRRTQGGYSLEALTGDKRVMSGAQLCHEEELFGKVSMKTIFGRRKVKKDGSEGKIITISPVEVLQREERKPWICYSVLDAKSTLKLYESLKNQLSNKPWKKDGKLVPGKSMFDFYKRYWQPFGELLVKMETEGMLVDRAYLAEVEKVANTEQEIAANRFLNWASRYCPDAKYMNVGSDAQLRQLFFGGIANSKNPNEFLPDKRIFKIPNVDKVIEEGKKAPTKFRNITLSSLLGESLPAETFTETGWPSVSGDALKTLAGKVSAEYDFMDDSCNLQLDENVEHPSENEVLEERKPPVCSNVDTSAYGTAFSAFKEGGEGREACLAIAALCQVCSIDSLISNFILPLQGSNISGKNGRIHCSLNINTETGRLSARRPNLQNQPALEKDRYKIRQAFIAAPGNSLVVADYGQLELRILAHLTSCQSMLDAFRAGGDFHSRTAMNMYPYIREAINKKQVLLEWHPQPGEDKPPVPLLKDAFASERRKAKMLNFSIAYGKTPVGLARDWKVSVKEAKQTVDLWYSDRKEVLSWQEERKKEARNIHCVYTLLGRARQFPSMAHCTNYQKGHIERAAINTPVQGSAADVAMCAMLEISKNARLKELGWKLLLQVHDEVILEGPTESAEEAKAIVVECMSKPFDGKNILNVDLSVDAKCAQNWYSAK